MMRFSKAKEQPEIIIEAEKKQPSFSQSEQREFRAETRKLLDIVAKSIYTDKEVFLRELRADDLSGSAGAYRLRLELLRRVNLAIAPRRVDAVLIEEMLIQ